MPIRDSFPESGSTYIEGESDGWEYKTVFTGTTLAHTFEMVKAFLREEGYGDIPLPANAEELKRFKHPHRNRQFVLFEDNGYARDEAKQVGVIGSCGQELCCSTWLPEFVPVSIKMAKDQGMVLSPTKVSGQCGRLKCCLVYEQATYAELRTGLPKLGKRVITAQGEGRVVEVDVIRQRVRVAFGPGESQMMPAAEVKPMFPPQGKPGAPAPEADAEPDDEPDEPAEEPVVDGTAPPDDPSLT